MAPKIKREPLRVQVREVLVDRLLRGELEPGSSLNESELCDELGISRTPLREALLRLEFEGFLLSSPGKGFSVRPLETETAEELTLIASDLERLAVSLTEDFSDDHLAELRRLNEKRRAVADQPAECVMADREWHDELVSRCGNEQLVQILDLVRNRLYRYGRAFMQDDFRVEEALDQHERIMDALERCDRDDALRGVEEHWETSRRAASEVLGGMS